jgi:hypothetical protein
VLRQKWYAVRNAAQHLPPSLLKRQIFKYGFNHQITVGKTAVIRRTEINASVLSRSLALIWRRLTF